MGSTGSNKKPNTYPRFSRTWGPKNAKAWFFMIKYFYGTFFLYAVPSLFLITKFETNEVISRIGMCLFFACGAIQLVWLSIKVIGFRKRQKFEDSVEG